MIYDDDGHDDDDNDDDHVDDDQRGIWRIKWWIVKEFSGFSGFSRFDFLSNMHDTYWS